MRRGQRRPSSCNSVPRRVRAGMHRMAVGRYGIKRNGAMVSHDSPMHRTHRAKAIVRPICVNVAHIAKKSAQNAGGVQHKPVAAQAEPAEVWRCFAEVTIVTFCVTVNCFAFATLVVDS